MDKETVQLLIKFFQDAGNAVSPLVLVWMIGQNVLSYITWLLTFFGLYRLVIRGIRTYSQEEDKKALRDALGIGSPGVLTESEWIRTREELHALIKASRSTS
jgi:hypothetical protein